MFGFRARPELSRRLRRTSLSRRGAIGIRIGYCGFPVAQPHYARVFQVVEVQQTFYQVPRITTLARWRERLPNPFEFTLKAWQLITHEALSPTYRRLSERFTASQMRRCGAFQPIAEVREAWEHTAAAARALGAGVILFQCPASFVPTAEHLENLRHFFGGVDRGDFKLIWEPRGRWQASVVRQLCRELDLIHAVDPVER